MVAYTYTRGHKTYYNEEDGEWKYCDDDSSALIERPCTRCGHLAYKGGEDYCLGLLDSRDIVAACCGHGIDGQGYIKLKDGRIFRLVEEKNINYAADENMMKQVIQELLKTTEHSCNLYTRVWTQMYNAIPELPIQYHNQFLCLATSIAMVTSYLTEATEILSDFDKWQEKLKEESNG